MPFTTESLIESLKDQNARLETVDLDTLNDSLPVACVDGRNHDCVACAPGGNAGLFLLGLAALDRVTARAVVPEDVSALFDDYLATLGRFYLHTDRAAVARLVNALEAASGRALPRSPHAQSQWLRCPPEDLRGALLDRLVTPPYVGCGHLKHILQHPDAYAVRLPVVRALLRTFFVHVWNGDDRTFFDVLTGSHDEQAVVCLHGPDDAHEPLYCPQIEPLQVFVHHPDVVAYLERAHARFFVANEHLAPGDVATFRTTHRTLAAQHLHTTLNALAPELPVFDVSWTDDGLVVE